MKNVFVKTNNVKRFITMMNNLQNRAEGVPGMALVYGEPGLGKTQTINSAHIVPINAPFTIMIQFFPILICLKNNRLVNY